MQSVLMGLLAFVTTLGPTEESPRSQYEALVKEYDTGYKAFVEAVTKASTDEERVKASGNRPQPQDLAPRFFALAEEYNGDPAALDALTWIASHCLFGPTSEKALGILAREYSRSERLVAYCGQTSRYGEPFEPYEEMLRAVSR